MTSPNYDYYGLLASTWDLWRDDTANWGDRHFYLKIAQQYGQPVLDIGCGTGRLVLDYSALGIDTDGIDNSPEMLEIARAKAEKMGISPGLYQATMQTLDLPRKYRTIIAPSSALQLLTDPTELKAAMRRIIDHLEPGGALIGSFAFEWVEGEPLDTGFELLFDKVRPEDGATVRSWVREWRTPETHLWHTEQRFEVEKDGKIVANEEQRRSPEGRWYSQAEAVQLYEDAGLTNVQLFHEFEGTPVQPDDRLFCVLGVKPL